MKALGKRILSTIVILATGAATILGILVDAPEAIQRFSQHFPSWLTNPDVWWVGAMLVLCGIALSWVWAKPSSERTSGDHIVDGLQSEFEIAIDTYERAVDAAQKAPAGKQIERLGEGAEKLLRHLENPFVHYLEHALGYQERDRFKKGLRRVVEEISDADEMDPTKSPLLLRYAFSFIHGVETKRRDERIRQMSAILEQKEEEGT